MTNKKNTREAKTRHLLPKLVSKRRKVLMRYLLLYVLSATLDNKYHIEVGNPLYRLMATG
jgi:hypothetical protein